MTSLLIEDRAVRRAQELNISYPDALAWVFDHPETGMGRPSDESAFGWITNGIIERFVAKSDLPKGWRYGRKVRPFGRRAAA